MIKKLAVLTLLYVINTSSFAYKMADYEKFNKPSDCQKCDLTQVDFPKNISNLNFEHTFFTGSENIDNITAYNSNFSNSNFVYVSGAHSEFINSNFNDAKLDHASFYATSFAYSSFVNTNMENSNFSNSNFTYVDFKNAKLKNSDLSFSNLFSSNITKIQLRSLKSYACARLPNGDIFDNDGEIDCYLLAHKSNKLPKTLKNQIKKVKQQSSKLSSPTDLDYFFTNKECTNCDLSDTFFCDLNSDLNNSSIYSSDLHHSQFAYCNFSSSTLINNFISSSSIQWSNFMQASFRGSQMDYSSVYGGAFSEASFEDTSLKKVRFDYTNLSSTDFSNANTQGTIFYRAILIGSNITKKQLEKSESLACSVLPNGDVAPSEDGDDCGLVR